MPTHATAGPDAEGKYRCCDCQTWKNPDAFHKNLKIPRGLSSRCRNCHAVYVRRPETRAKNREYGNRRYRESGVAQYVRSLRDRPCADCGRRFPTYCMEFDHVDRTQKIDNIANMLGGGFTPKLLAEIEKCEIVCACCHRIRTRERDGVVPFAGKFGKNAVGRPRKADGEW